VNFGCGPCQACGSERHREESLVPAPSPVKLLILAMWVFGLPLLSLLAAVVTSNLISLSYLSALGTAIAFVGLGVGIVVMSESKLLALLAEPQSVRLI
jgi:hypothetical protein